MDRVDGLDFHEEALIDQQIELERVLALELLVPDGDDVLTPDDMASQLEFHRQAPLINRFQQSRPLILVHFDRGPDHVVSHSGRLGK
jgi:hypothetical protein